MLPWEQVCIQRTCLPEAIWKSQYHIVNDSDLLLILPCRQGLHAMRLPKEERKNKGQSHSSQR